MKENRPEMLQRSEAVAGMVAVEVARVLVAKELDWTFTLHTLPVPESVSYSLVLLPGIHIVFIGPIGH